MIIADAEYLGLERIGNMEGDFGISKLHGQAPGVPIYKVIKITKVKPATPKKSPAKSPRKSPARTSPRKSPSPARPARELTAAERARLRGPPAPRPPSPSDEPEWEEYEED